MNSTEVQNHRRKLYDKYLCLSCVRFCSCLHVQSLLTCFRSSLTRFVDFVSNNSSSESVFYVSLRSKAPQQQYTVHCMNYGITPWVCLSEPHVKDSHKRLSLTEKPANYRVLKSLYHNYRYVRVTERYTDTLHVKKMDNIVALVYNASNF